MRSSVRSLLTGHHNNQGGPEPETRGSSTVHERVIGHFSAFDVAQSRNRSKSKRPADCWLEAPRVPLWKAVICDAKSSRVGWTSRGPSSTRRTTQSSGEVGFHRSAHLQRSALERPPVSIQGEGRPKHHQWIRSRMYLQRVVLRRPKQPISSSPSGVSVAAHKARMAAMQTAAEDLRPCLLGTSDLTPQCRNLLFGSLPVEGALR